MSTDTDDEGGGGGGGGSGGRVVDASKTDNTITTLLITANVGSIFEDADGLIPTWRERVLSHIARSQARFVAIHFQEVNFDEYRFPREEIIIVGDEKQKSRSMLGLAGGQILLCPYYRGPLCVRLCVPQSDAPLSVIRTTAQKCLPRPNLNSFVSDVNS